MLEPDDVLAIWVAAHGPLDETKAAAFLARPELDQLCSLPRDVVTSAIASSPKLTVALEQTRRPTPEPIPTPGGPSDDDAEFEAEARHHLARNHSCSALQYGVDISCATSCRVHWPAEDGEHACSGAAGQQSRGHARLMPL